MYIHILFYVSFSRSTFLCPNRISMFCVVLVFLHYSQCSNGLLSGWPGFYSWQERKFILFSTKSTLVLGPTQPPIQWVLGTLVLGVKWPRHEAGDSSHLVSRSRMVDCAYAPICLHGMVLN
jgi:hypothetical protein